MWLHLATLAYSNQVLSDLPDEAFLHRQPCAVDRGLKFICVAVAYLVNLFLMCFNELKSRGFKSGDCGGQKSETFQETSVGDSNGSDASRENTCLLKDLKNQVI